MKSNKEILEDNIHVLEIFKKDRYIPSSYHNDVGAIFRVYENTFKQKVNTTCSTCKANALTQIYKYYNLY